MRHLAFLLCLPLGGCLFFFVPIPNFTARMVPIDYASAPPSDWPALEERVAVVQLADIPKTCYGLGAAATKVQSCAVTSFRYGVCYIYVVNDDAATLEHERAHCKGYGHVGDANTPAAAWESYKKRSGI